MRVTYPQWMNFDGSGGRPGGGVMNGGVRQGKGKGKNWNVHYQNSHQHYNYNNGYPSYHNHNQMMRMTMSTGPTMTSRVHRKVLRIPSKRHPGKALPGKIHSAARIGGKVLPGKRLRPQQNTHCDNSNDSGLGYDQYADTPYANIKQVPSTRLTSSSGAESPTIGRSRLEIEDGRSQNNQYAESYTSSNGINALLTATKCDVPSTSSAINIIDSEMIEADETKPQKFDHKFDIDDTCSNDAFAFNACLKGNPLKSNQKTTTVPCNASKITPISRANNRPAIRRTAIGSQILNAPNNNMGVSGTVTLQTQIGAISQNGKCQLQILAQPEQQHRARYQTEGSRGAVKDRSGNGFPIVKLVSYDKPTTLQIFIGTDVGRVAPHMFYQACKVSGKNSTPCNEKKVEGTIVIEIDLKPDSDMTATCDCVGILKERNVDVEHRFPDQTAGPRSKKKSTRCRMVFRTQITHDDGTIETLQVCSQQIICTSKKPIYTLGYRNVLERLSTTPGPGTYTVTNSTLNQTKAYTFGSRPEQKVRSGTPAPNQYAVDSNFTRTPSFTFGGRRKVEKPNQTPAPGTYSPCNVDTRETFTFNSRPEQKIKSDAPAPNLYAPEKCKQEFKPSFSFGGRHNLEKPNQTPAPGSYAPEKCNLNQQASYSFGLRTEQKLENFAPAPNQYSPEKCKQEFQPAFSFGGRHDTEKPNKTPAPGAYSPEKCHMDYQPAFSFGSRPEEKIKNIAPAPNAYQPEKCNLEHQPAFSFGLRPEEKIRSDSPAPNMYSPEKCKLEHQPAFSFGGRHNTDKPSQTPDPGAYSPEKSNLEFQPAFSFGSRPEEKIKNIAPAPNAYQPEKCNLEHQPAFSFGLRPEEKIRSDSPAPNMYSPEKCKLEHQPAFSFGGRYNTDKPSQTPAPGAYSPEKSNLEHQPAFSFGTRQEEKITNDAPAPNHYQPCKLEHQPAFSFGGRYNTDKHSQTPAPGAYSPEKANLEHQPAFSFGSRPVQKVRSDTPAPSAYAPEKVNLKQTPAFSFGLKIKQERYSETPAPNEYSIPTVLGSSKEAHIRSAPAYTLVGRQKTTQAPSIRFPGPGAYDGHYESVMHKSPHFSMGQRIAKKTKDSGPGPGSHFPEKVNLSHVPAFSFGIRHSAYLGNFTDLKKSAAKKAKY